MSAHLTKRERALRTMRQEETDQVALYDILDNDAVIEYYAGERLTPINGDRVKGKAIGRLLDMTRMPGGPQAPRRVTNPDGLTWQLERWTSWIVERPWSDIDGLIAWVKERIVELRAWQPDAAYVEQTHEHIRRTQAFFACGAPARDDLPILVLESGAGVDRTYALCGLEWYTMLMCFEPQLLDEWIEETNQWELRRVRAIADPQLIPVALTHDDLASKNGPLFSPDWIREHEIPRLKRLVETWQERGTQCLFHSDGNLMPILDDLAGAGINGLNPLETGAGMSLRTVRERHPQLFLTGGIDVSQLLPNGTPEQVRERCREALAETDGGRGYFLGSTTELLDAVPLANARAMYESVLGEAR
jgi:hypothetical protein